MKLRGSFGAFTQIYVIVGIVVSYTLGLIFYLTDAESQLVWRFMFCFPAFTILMQSLLLMFDFIPESPVSLLNQNKEWEARKILEMFNEDDYFESALAEAKHSLKHELKESDS